MPVTTGASGIKPGTVAHFAGSSAPPGWLKANGALVSRQTYAGLFLAIGTTYGAGDGATTFALPDLRGEFLRGLDDGRGVDAGRTIGSAQSDDFKSHTHGGAYGRSDVGGSTGPTSGSAGWGVAIPNTGGAETRPRNVAQLACIKF